MSRTSARCRFSTGKPRWRWAIASHSLLTTGSSTSSSICRDPRVSRRHVVIVVAMSSDRGDRFEAGPAAEFDVPLRVRAAIAQLGSTAHVLAEPFERFS